LKKRKEIATKFMIPDRRGGHIGIPQELREKNRLGSVEGWRAAGERDKRDATGALPTTTISGTCRLPTLSAKERIT